MTDQHDPLNELASAHLDGRTTPDEAARVTSDPALAARVARFESARAALRATANEPGDARDRDAAIAAALAVFDEQHVNAVTPLRARSWWSDRRTLRVAAVAAAVALLALAAPLLGRLDREPDENEASVAESDAPLDEKAADDGSGVGGVADRTQAPGAADAATALAVPPDLGAFADLDALAAAVRARMDPAYGADTTSAVDASTTTMGAPACEEVLAALGPRARYSAVATVDEQPVVVVAAERDDATVELVVLDRATCAELTRSPL